MNATNETLVVLRVYDSAIKAEIAKSILDSAGIFCVLHGEYMSAIYTPVAFPVRLMVKAEDCENATAVLDER
ncbi:MAG: DUF2007 domain-containing protein [Alistipes sp.]|jgi:hypothetical protein|nr:DUF2007 domain-containing protein [Alistipes sp.]